MPFHPLEHCSLLPSPSLTPAHSLAVTPSTRWALGHTVSRVSTRGTPGQVTRSGRLCRPVTTSPCPQVPGRRRGPALGQSMVCRCASRLPSGLLDRTPVPPSEGHSPRSADPPHLVSGLRGKVCLQPHRGSVGPALVSGPQGPALPGAGPTVDLTESPRPPPLPQHRNSSPQLSRVTARSSPPCEPQSKSAPPGHGDQAPGPRMEAGRSHPNVPSDLKALEHCSLSLQSLPPGGGSSHLLSPAMSSETPGLTSPPSFPAAPGCSSQPQGI